MSLPRRFPWIRRDPWWDVEGRAVRRARLRRRVGRLLVFVVVVVLVGAGVSVTAARAASLSVNLDQWAPLEAAWQNGNLNGNNARYPEGGVVPFRLAIEGLAPGAHSIRINYDVTAGGHKAYDFLASWNAFTAPDLCGATGTLSSLCPALPSPSSAAIPSDPYVMDGLSVTAAQVYSGAARRVTLWGGTVTSISTPVHSGPFDGNSTAEVTVQFTSTGSAVLMAWGGHLAQSAFWNLAAGGERDGAGEVSGAPWHMRTLQLDGSGNRNQDRSIQPSAIVGELPPGALAPPTITAPAAPVAPAPAPPASTAPGTPTTPAAPAPPGVAPTPPPTATLPSPGDGPGDGAAAALAAAGALLVAVLVATARRRAVR